MATKKTKRYDDGGMTSSDDSESAAKQRGLAESNKEAPVGFFERLRMGNIDDPNSEAYRRFGAGRGRATSVPVEDRTPTPVKSDVDAANASDDPIASMNKSRGWTASDDSDASSTAPSKISAPAESSKPAAAKESSKPAAAKPSSSKASVKKADSGSDGRGAVDMSAYKPRRDSTRQRTREELFAAIPDSGGEPSPSEGNSASGSELGRNVSNTLMAASGLFPPARIAAKAAQGAQSAGRALTTAAETPVTYLGRSGERVINAPRLTSKAQEAARDMGAIERDTATAAARKAKVADMGPKAPSKPKSLPPPQNRRNEVLRAAQELKRREQAATRDAQVMNRKAWALGPSAMKPFANGGVVGRRGDGIAQRGRTKGVMR